MAFAAITGGFSAQSKTANQTVLSLTPDQTYPIGTFMVLFVTTDDHVNDGATPHVSSVIDDGANTWTRVTGTSFNSSQGGVSVSMWYSKLTTALTTADTVDCNFSNSANRDATAAWCKGFTIGSGTTVQLEGTPATSTTSGGDPASMAGPTTANIECLRIRGIGGETSSTTALTPTSGWTVTPSNQTTGGGGATNQAVRGEFRISTGTGATSDPTWVNTDNGSVYAAFKEVTLGVQLSGSAVGAATVSGGLSVTKRLSGAGNGAGVASGSFGIRHTLSGSIVGDGVSSGSVTHKLRFFGAINGAGVADGDLSLSKLLSGSITGDGVSSGVLQLTKRLSGSVTGAGSVGAPEPSVENASSGAGSGLSITVSHTITDADYLVVGVGNRNQGNVTDVTYGNIGLTFLGRSNGVIGSKIELWVLDNPPVGTDNIVATFASSQLNTVMIGVGILNASGYRTMVHGAFAGTDASVDVPSGVGDLVVDFLNTWFQAPVIGAGQTQIREQVGLVSQQREHSSRESGASPTVTMSWGNPNGNGNFTQVAVSFTPFESGLSVTKTLSGSAVGEAIVAGSFAFHLFLSGSAVGEAVVTGALREGVLISLDGSAVGAGTASGNVTLTKRLSGAGNGAAIVSGDLSLIKRLDGSIGGAGIVTGILAIHHLLTGSIVGAGIASGGVTKTVNLSGAPDGNATVSGSLGITKPLSGNASGAASVNGSILLYKALQGIIEGQGIVTGGLTLKKLLEGVIIATSVSDGDLQLTKRLSGSVNGVAIVNGTLGASVIFLSGESTGTASVVGAVQIKKPLSGSVLGSGATDGTLSLRRRLSGSATGTGTASGTIRLTKRLTGEIVGESVASGGVRLRLALSGAITGSGIADGELFLVKPLGGSVIGVGVLSGTMAGVIIPPFVQPYGLGEVELISTGVTLVELFDGDGSGEVEMII